MGGVSCAGEWAVQPGVQGEGWGRTGMGEVLVGASLERVPPAASTQSGPH